MKNKIFNSFLLIGNVLYTIGLVLTSVLIIRANKSNQMESFDLTLLFLPLIISTFLSIILFCLYYYNKRTYLLLVKMHINIKWIFFHYLSGLFLCFGILVTAILMWVSNVISIEMQNEWYFYFVIAMTILSLISSYALDAYSNFKISIDIARRKMGDNSPIINSVSINEHINDFNSIADDNKMDHIKDKEEKFIEFNNKNAEENEKTKK